jgi:N6-adenosine-specific RNA methylase IME4
MTTEDIKNLPVAAVTAKNAICNMWAIDSMLPDALATMEAWGFTFKTVGWTWLKTTKTGKDHFGMGYYTRANPEMCLIGTKGKPGRVADRSIRQLFRAEIREHSRKPDEMYDYIERLWPDKQYLELFARASPRPNWTKLGNEVGKF